MKKSQLFVLAVHLPSFESVEDFMDLYNLYIDIFWMNEDNAKKGIPFGEAWKKKIPFFYRSELADVLENRLNTLPTYFCVEMF